MRWLKEVPELFNQEKLDRFLELLSKIEQLQAIKNPRQAIKSQLQQLEQERDSINPFVSPEAEQQFWEALEAGDYDKEAGVE